jgi:hypothetical protein
MRSRLLNGVSFLPVFGPPDKPSAGDDQPQLQLDPAEVAAHGDPDWEANDPNDAGTVAKEGQEEPEPDDGKTKEPEPEPAAPAEGEPEPASAPANSEEDDGEPKTEAELKAALAQSRKALKAVSGRLAAKAADNRRLNEELQKTIKPVPEAEPAAAEGEGEQPQRADFKTKAEFDAAVLAEAERVAERKLAVQTFTAQCNEVEDKGSDTYKAKWVAAKAQLGLLDDEGRIPLELLTTALETDNPAKVLFELGSDIEKATEFLAMTPLRRAIAMAKIAEGKPVPRPQSKTPPPVDLIGGRGGGDDRPSDRDSDEEWNRKEEIRERQVAEARRKRGY